MKKIVGGLTLIAMMMVSVAAFAQDDVPEQSYDFVTIYIDGQSRAPDITRYDLKDKAKFQRLIRLKTSFLSKVRQTGEEPALN